MREIAARYRSRGRTRSKGQRAAIAPMVLAAGLAVVLTAGCGSESGPLELHQLRPAERLYVERYITLERARAVALAEPALGVALLDSLAAAWGDSAAVEAEAALTGEPRRAARLHGLVQRLLEAEADSLIQAPHPRRLHEPLPDPIPRSDDSSS